MASLTDILNYYADKLVAQYRDQPKARATIAIFGKQIAADDIASVLEVSFSIDTAVGPQLDVLGKYIGVSRNIGDTIPDTNSYFGFADYTGPANINGFADYIDPFANPGCLFYLYQYAIGIPSALTDDQYRLVLKLQIIANSSDGTLYSLIAAMQTFLDGSIQIVDAQDMSLVYVLYTFPSISLTVLRRFLPRPMTLGVSVVVVSPVQRCLDDGATLRKIDTGAIRALIAG